MDSLKVQWLIDDVYQVIQLDDGISVLFQGDLASCDAFVNLKSKGLLI